MHTSRFSWALLLGLTILLPAARGDDEPDLFTRLDTNKDGQLTAEEVGPRQKPFFERLVRTADKNADGKLSREEFVAGTKDPPAGAAEDRPRDPPRDAPRDQPRPDPARAEQLFDEYDANKDGKLTEEEVQADKRATFRQMVERLDDDGDKALTKAQFTRALATLQAGEPRRDGDRPPGGPRDGGHPLMAALDLDRDGKISASEIADAPKVLAKLDLNGDGQITPDELRPPGGERRPEGVRPDGDRVQFFLRGMKDADKNGDGKLSREEAPQQLKDNFDRLDTNRDGQIDEAEVRQLLGVRTGGDRPPGDRPPVDRPRPDGDRRDPPPGERPPRDGDRPVRD